MTEFVVVALFAIVQSLFGVGLLIFGTPTLLLLGYPFADTLAVLLPASLAISLLQLRDEGAIERRFVVRFAAWCLLPLAAGLTAVLVLNLKTSLNLFVALALATFVVLRVNHALNERARQVVVRHGNVWLLLMGLVHGLSNLGGGLLTILAASLFREKEAIRKLIAFCYACFAAIQLGVLAFAAPESFGAIQIAYAATAAAVFLGVGQMIFRRISAPMFERLFTALMASYAVLLFLRVADVL